MRAMIKQGTTAEAHPSYWAPFVVVGEGRSNRSGRPAAIITSSIEKHNPPVQASRLKMPLPIKKPKIQTPIQSVQKKAQPQPENSWETTVWQNK